MPVGAIPASLSWAHPLVAEWFVSRFGTPTEPQEQGWPEILADRTTLISAPTGSGKTLAAFLICIDRLVRKALAGELRDCTEVLYVSPLKALGNDIQKNLEGPLSEILALAAERGFLMPEIRTAVRTGDTLMKERRDMLKRPPHILVTTPESLYILLTANSSRAILSHVKTVIVDEIHAVADDKRGSHLTLSLERLDLLANGSTRIGLSATQKPIEEVAHFLTGADRPAPAIVNIGHRRKLDLAVEVPRSELGPIASNEMWGEIYDRIAELALQHRSTLVFVNTRRLAERVTLHLGERIGEELVATHHGSLARKLRLAAERKLKNGEIRLLVATASLELGIDIGTVDLVCQINSPRSIAVALQRVGRAGHWRGAVSKGRLFATTRDDLIECAATVRAIRQGDLDVLQIPASPLDILAQQIVAMCACEDWDADALFDCVRRAYPYRDLKREDYDRILEMLSLGIAAKRGRYGAYLFRDMVNRRLRARRGARLAAITSGGAIPDTALFTVVAQPEEIVVGTVDEDFAVESNAGDIMLLGNTSWRIRRVASNSGRVLVEDAHGAPPTIPFWRGEAPARTDELSFHVAELRERISTLLPNTVPLPVPANPEAAEQLDRTDNFVGGGVEHPFRGASNGSIPVSSEPASAGGTPHVRFRGLDSSPEVQTAIVWLKDKCGLDDSAAEQAIEYIITGRAVLGGVPTLQTIIAERFFDEGGGMQLIIHAPFGGRINKAWGLALRKRFCRSFNFELQAAATDNGLNIALAEQHSFPLSDVFHYLQTETVQEILEQAALASPIFATRWRWDANRSLALLRFQGGKKVPPQIQRIRSDDLLASVFPDVAACQENIEGDIHIPDHPLVQEVMKDVLTEAMDIDGLRRVIEGIRSGAIRCLAVDTPVPSQFSHEILNANPYAYLDDAPLEERRARAVQMRRILPEAVLNEVGKLDQQAIARVTEEARPDVRDADELHDTLQTLVALPEEVPDHDWQQAITSWLPLSAELLESWRVVRAKIPTQAKKAWAGHPTGAMEAKAQPASADDTAGARRYYVASERAKDFALIFPEAQFEVAPPELPSQTASRDDALLAMVNGWMMHSGPIVAKALAYRLGLDVADVDKTLLRLEASGSILRGNFTGQIINNETEWCERRLLSRIHHLTVATLRKQVEPVTAAQFMRWLLRWQHIAPQSQMSGERGLLQVVRQLQGFEIPANAWEKQVLARRVNEYDPATLDQLCLTGAVGWGRLSPHPATLEDSGEGRRRVVPTSVAPITFFVREESDWMQPRLGEEEQSYERVLSPAAHAVLEFLRRRGASFFADIVRGTGKLKAEIETALWELVAAGMVTADGFDNLRSLINPKRRLGTGSAKAARPRHTPGRWSLLFPAEGSDRSKVAEATCWMLLRRYGVVFREVLARESNLPKWRDLLIAFRRLEDRGEVRGGRFVSGFLGEQFALPEAVESLRAMRNLPPSGETITISAADPLNLVGFIVPGDRVPAISGKYVSFRDGVATESDDRPSILREAAGQ